MATAEQITVELRDLITRVFAGLDPWFMKDARVRAFRSRNEAWDIGQILEHVSLVNHYLMLIIDKGARKAIKRADETAIEQELKEYNLAVPGMEDIGVNNSFEWKSPDHMLPRGLNPPDRVRETLLNQKTRLMDYLAMLKNGEGVMCKTHMSVHSLGKLDVYQYIYFLLKHAQRHIQQMEGIEDEYMKIH